MSTTTETKKSLFGAAKKVEPAKKEKSKEAITIPGMADKIKRFTEIKLLLETLEAEKALLEGDLKSVGKEKYLDKYLDEKKRPESFKMVDEGNAVLLMIQDKYLSVSEDKAQILSCYDNVLDTQETYTFNAEILEQCGEVISDLIMNSTELTDHQKENLLVKTEKHSVKKGTIERLMQFENPREVFELIQPIVMLKNSK